MLFADADIHSLHCLIYFSRAEVRAADELPAMMRDILQGAVVRNTCAGISGALLACDRWFVQALEGERLAVGEVYHSICRDTRHRDLRIIAAGPIGGRRFADWSMCGQTLSPTDDAILQILETKPSFDPDGLTGASALKLLDVVRKLQVRPAPVGYV